jgi:hypothetical protein
MARSKQSYRVAASGLSGSACADTIITINDPGRKDALYMCASFGAAGAPIDVPTSYSRLVVIAGDLQPNPDGTPFNVGLNAASPSIADYGGTIIFDVDLVFCVPASGVITAPLWQFNFAPDADDGRVGVSSGALSFYLAAARDSTGTRLASVTGNLFVQYKTLFQQAQTRNYAVVR